MSKMQTISMFEIDEVAAKREEISKVADAIYNEIILDKKVPTMKESIFAGYFLPKLIGKMDERSNEWIGEWIGAVGSVATEVDVVSDSTGEVLFRSPPILQTNKLGLREGQGTLQDIVKGFMMRNGNPIADSEGYMKHKLSETYTDLVKDLDISDDVSRWRFILGKYGYLDLEEGEETIETQDEGDLEDLIIY